MTLTRKFAVFSINHSPPPAHPPSYPLNSSVSSCWPWGDTLSIWDIQEINHSNISGSLRTTTSLSTTGFFPQYWAHHFLSDATESVSGHFIISIRLTKQTHGHHEGRTSFLQATSMGGGAVSTARLLTSLVNWPQEGTELKIGKQEEEDAGTWIHQTCLTVDIRGLGNILKELSPLEKLFYPSQVVQNKGGTPQNIWGYFSSPNGSQ